MATINVLFHKSKDDKYQGENVDIGEDDEYLNTEAKQPLLLAQKETEVAFDCVSEVTQQLNGYQNESVNIRNRQQDAVRSNLPQLSKHTSCFILKLITGFSVSLFAIVFLLTSFWTSNESSVESCYGTCAHSNWSNVKKSTLLLSSMYGSSAHSKRNFNNCPINNLRQITTELNITVLYKRIKFPPVDPTNELYVSDGADVETNISFIINPRTNATKWTAENKLKVFVVLHSHNDAGWLETTEVYYNEETKQILDHILKYLTLDRNLKFVWSEMSFFDLWWKDLSRKKRLQFKHLVANGQIEFVGGGWVMHDEATPHYLSMITQLVEGHQWLKNHLNYTPSNGWAIDPFGLSSTSQFLLQRAGFKSTVFSRIHYLLRLLLVKEKKTEFYWRQQWDTKGDTDIFAYLMPYGTYDWGSTCGPDKGVCTVFQGERDGGFDMKIKAMTLLEEYRKKSMLFHTNNVLLPIGSDFTWNTENQWTQDIKILKDVFHIINSNKDLNTEIKFATLDEYFKAVQSELNETHINTLNADKTNFKFPIFSGDFFTYSDHTQDYWSGYFTSRIFHKVNERRLMSLVRSAQLIYTLMAAEISDAFGTLDFPFIERLLQRVVESRRILSLFQHHDGISGTARDFVVRDYSLKLFHATHECHSIIHQCIHILQIVKHGQGQEEPNINLAQTDIPLVSREVLHKVNEFSSPYETIVNSPKPNKLWKDTVLSIGPHNPVETIAVFNSLAKTRRQIVRVAVTNPYVKVFTSSNGEELTSEIFPVFDSHFLVKYSELRMLGDSDQNGKDTGTRKNVHKRRGYQYISDAVQHYQLCFVADFGPLEIRHFKIVFVYEDVKIRANISSGTRIRIINQNTNYSQQFIAVNAPMDSANKRLKYKFITQTSSKEIEAIQISNGFLKIRFNENGTTKSVEIDGVSHSLNITFHRYRTQQSGLYLFYPFGAAEPIDVDFKDQHDPHPTIIIVEGNLQSYVEVHYPKVKLTSRVTIFHHNDQTDFQNGIIHVENKIDIRQQDNYELVMKIDTQIQSKKMFFTDSNGFQIMKRELRDNLPVQGNYYPMATSAYIEDPDLRLTVLAGQPGGCSSLTSGQLEIMLDRITNQDDGKGVGQGGEDNLPTVSKFQIILEKPSLECSPTAQDSKSKLPRLPLLSLEANLAQLNLLHPLIAYRKTSNANKTHADIKYALNRSIDKDTGSGSTAESNNISCDIHLLSAVPLAQFTDSTTESSKHSNENDTTIYMTPLSQSALLFHRFGYDHRFKHSKMTLKSCRKPNEANMDTDLGGGVLNIQNLFGSLFQSNILQTSLTLSHRYEHIDASKELKLEPMDIYAFVANFSGSENSSVARRHKFVSYMPTISDIQFIA